MDLIQRAQLFAHMAHDAIGQKRKYTGEPYWVHTDAVADLVASVGGSEEMITASHLHDVIEDVMPILPDYNLILIAATFGNQVADYVNWLTDEYTKEAWPDLNRSRRKALERQRISRAPAEVKTIKLADLIHNTESIVAHDADFAKTYLKEKAELLPCLVEGNQILWTRADKQVRDSVMRLGFPEILNPIDKR